MQMIWASLLESEQTLPWRRSRLFFVGEGGAGKTSLIRALLNMIFIATASTIGACISTLDATNTHEWAKMPGTEYQQVTLCIGGYELVGGCVTHATPSCARQAIARLVGQLSRAEDQLKQVFATKKDDEKALRRALKTAKDVGLSSGYSLVVRDVEAHFRKVVMTTCKDAHRMFEISLYTDNFAFTSPKSLLR